MIHALSILSLYMCNYINRRLLKQFQWMIAHTGHEYCKNILLCLVCLTLLTLQLSCEWNCDRLYQPMLQLYTYTLKHSNIPPTHLHSVAMATTVRGVLNERFCFLPGLRVKEHSQIVAQHNRLRSRVQPMAANMQKMVCGIYCLFLQCVL